MMINNLKRQVGMNSKRAQSSMDPLAQGKIARLEGTVGTLVSPGAPKADDLPHYSQDKSLPYRRTYMSSSLSGQETLDLPSAWSPSRTCVRNGGSPVGHSSATEGSISNQVLYRPENVLFPMDSDSSAAAEELAAKHKLSYCNRRKHSPNSAGIVSSITYRKMPIGYTSLSPSAAENSGLAIPKPVYGHSPCCTDRKCTVGHNYTVEQGLPRVPHQMFEDDWATSYNHWAYLQKKEHEARMQQRILSFEHCGERVLLKDVTTQGYHGVSLNRPRRASAFTEPSHSNYTYSPSQPLFPASQEHCQRFQMHPQIHKHLPPMYQPLTRMQYGAPAQVYQDHPHISKYGEIPQDSLLYCPQNNTEVYGPDSSHHIVEKQRSGQCPVPQPYYSDLPNPYSMVPASHPAIRNLPSYPGYRMHLSSSQMNPFTDQPCPPPIIDNVDRPLDFSIRREQNADFPPEPHGQFRISGTFQQTQAPDHLSAHNCTLGPSEKSQHSFLVGSSHNYTASPQRTDGLLNKKQDENISDKSAKSTSISKRPREGNDDTLEMDFLGKIQKVEQISAKTQPPFSPPMPVINKVFSLAPYKAYLEAAGMFHTAQDSNNSKLQIDVLPPNEEPETQNTDTETETQNTDPKPTLGQDDLQLKAVKTTPACSRDSEELEILNVKKEKVESGDVSCQSEMNASSSNCKDGEVKEEPAACYTEHNLVIVKSDLESEYKPLTPKMPEPPLEWKTEPSVMDRAESIQTLNSARETPKVLHTLSPKPPTPPQTIFSLNKIPVHCLKLSSYNIILPEVLKVPVPSGAGVLQTPAVTRPAMSSIKRAQRQVIDLHQSLCRLISCCVSQTSHWELKEWLSSLNLVSPPSKTQKVSCLLGSKAREVWLRGEETVTALEKVLNQFQDYIKGHECPFPHVIRAGAVFIPMLVVKEVLFPQVQGTFINQVLQKHRVELRPTTLSEERHLTSLDRRAFSSKLRRLLSLKHLPDIYPDVLNLLYYDSACKFLDSTRTDDVQKMSQRRHESRGVEHVSLKRESGECSDEAESTVMELVEHCAPPKPQTPDTMTHLENLKEAHCLKKNKNKSRVKSSCKRMFLGDDSSSSESEPAEASAHWCFENSVDGEVWENVPTASSLEEGHVEVTIEEDTEQELENSWGRPLSSDDLSSECSNTETEASSWLSPQRRSSSRFSKSHSGMVLKLRKVYYTNGRQGQVSHYQRVSDHSEAPDVGSCKNRHHRRKREKRDSKHKKQHTFSSPHRPKFCPYISTQGVSKHTQRRVLRSAGQTTRQGMSNKYPVLVGKRIRHLYEENDKTEVWYRGIVLRIHEPHPNPLKTVFEVKYDSEPEWQYYLELLVDYKKGWLKIED